MALRSVLLFCTIAIAGSAVTARHVARSPQNASSILPDTYVAGGRAAAVGQFPWLARLSIRDCVEKASYMCAGSLISDRHVLSAAHCFDKDIESYHDIAIYLGEYNTQSYPKDCVQGRCTKNELVYPDKLYVHSQYDSTSTSNDVALLRLEKRAPLSATIKPIALPFFNLDHDRNDGASVLIAGWGTTEHGSLSTIPLTTEISLIPKGKCLKMNFNVPAGHFCAGNPNGKDTCPGDSGGPLMMYYNKKYYVAGIVSFGPDVKCGTAKAGYYTNVFQYMKWIKSHMN